MCEHNDNGLQHIAHRCDDNYGYNLSLFICFASLMWKDMVTHALYLSLLFCGAAEGHRGVAAISPLPDYIRSNQASLILENCGGY